MHAKHVVLVNWGTVPSDTYPLEEITAITGQTGAGKSTQLDALVTLMSAGISQIGRLNMASEDGASHRQKRKSYRRAEEYVVGMAKDGLCRSPNGAHGYIAVAFSPDEGEGDEAQAFTAVMGISASKKEGEESQGEDTVFALVMGHEIDHTVLAPEQNGRRDIVKVTECLDTLRGLYGVRKGHKKTGVLGFKDEPRKFLRHLWAAFRGREELSQEEADRAAMVWCRFVPQEGIEDVSHFVRMLIMPDPRGTADFRGIRELIRTNREMTRRARALQQQKEILTEALEACQTHTSNYVLRRTLVTEGLELEQEARERERKSLSNQNIESRSLIEIREGERKAAVAAAERSRDQVVNLTAQLNGQKGYKEHEQLKADVASSTLALVGERSKAIAAVNRLGKVAQYVQVLELATQAKPLGDLASAVKRALFEAQLSTRVQVSDLDYVEGLPEMPRAQDWKELAVKAKPVETPFQRARVSLAGEGRELLALRAAAVERVDDLRRMQESRLNSMRSELVGIEKRKFLAPPDWAAETKAYIEREIPDANPVFLYELIKDVRDPEWQLAVEGMISDARFNIVVSQKHEQAVDSLLRVRKGRRTARLIQGARELKQAQGKVLPEASVASELIVDDPIARAYLTNQFSSALKQRDGTDMTQVGRGVRKDARGAGGGTTFNADENTRGRLYFGARALEQRKAELEHEIPELVRAIDELKNARALLQSLVQADDALVKLGEETLDAIAGRALVLLDVIAAKKAELAAMDITGFKELEAERDRVAEEQKAHAAHAEGLLKSISDEKREMDKRLDRIGQIDMQVEELQKQVIDGRNERARLAMKASWVSPAWLEERKVALVASGKSRQDNVTLLRTPLATSMTKIGLAVSKFNDAVKEEGPLSVTELVGLDPELEDAFDRMADKYVEIDARIRQIAADHLSSASTELARHEGIMRTRFTEYFCDKLLLELGGAKAVLHQLNTDLRNHVFGAERYEFEAFDASADFFARRTFFEYVRDQMKADERFNPFDAPLSEEMIRVREEIVRLLSSEEEKDQRMLEIIADYRNYHLYEMYKVFQREGDEKPTRIPMSTNGKESGGEKENGILIARAATISSALGLRKPGPHLRFIAIDEMMKKTDEARIRESLDFLSERLGLQVLFVMPTRAIGPFKDLADLEYNVSRVNTSRPEGTLRDKVVVLRSRYDRRVVRAMREARAHEVKTEAVRHFEAEEAHAVVAAASGERAAAA